MTVFGWRTWLGFVYFGLFFFGLYIFLTDIEENKCEMTYMFENPEYIKQKLPEKLSKKYPKYNLYLYGEGRYADDLKKGHFSGIPVLFIPGSGGSHRQVRSIGSVALRMAYSHQSQFHFNFFTLDFNQEWSALYGGILWDQTLFLKECITFITDLYKSKGLTRSVILIGHSMGGVTAQAVFLLSKFDNNLISLIINKATPLKDAALNTDSHITNFYSDIHHFWNQSEKMSDIPPVISIGGGERDILVRSDLTVLKGNGIRSNISTVTTAMPGVWLSTDHLCILWCKQLVMTLSRCLFDLVDKNTLSITKDTNLIQEVTKFYFLERSRGHRFVPNSYTVPVTFSQTGEWIFKTERSWRFTRNKILQAVYILVPLEEGQIVAINAIGIEKLNWVFACNVSTSSKICVEGENLSDGAKVVPSFSKEKSENRLFRINAKDLIVKGHSHVLVHLPPSTKISIYGERYKPQTRHKIVILPTLIRSLAAFSPLKMLTSPLSEGAVYHNISLRGLTELWQHYSFSMETRICKHGVTGDGFVRYHVPWSNEDRYYPIKSSINSVTTIKGTLYTPRPANVKGYPQLHIVLNPDCSYVMFVRIPIGHLSAQYLRFFHNAIPAYVTALLLGALCAQIYNLSVKGTILSLLEARQTFPGFALLVIIPELIAWAIRNYHSMAPFIPKPDDIALFQQRYHFMMLRPIGFLISYGILVTLSLVSQAFLILAGRLVIWCGNGDKAPMLPNPKPTTSSSIMTLLACSLLTLISLCFCGALAMVVSLFIQLFKLVRMCGYNRIEEDRRGLTASSTRWHFHHCIFLLQLMATAVMSPSLVVWAQNVFNNFRLVNDPHLVPAIVTIMAHASLWQPAIPAKTTYRYKTIVAILAAQAVLTSMFSFTTTWRITHFVATAFAFIAAHQVASANLESRKID